MTASAGPALRKLHARYGDRVQFLSVYVREAHPGDHFPQPLTFEQKLEHARAYEARDEIAWTVAVDSVDGTLHRQLDEKPHSAYFVDASGLVAGRLLWANDVSALSDALDDLAAGRPVEIDEEESQLVPMMRGMGKMHDVLSAAGPQALRDLRREVPPVWFLASLAGRFRPLSPLGRGVAAMATIAGGLLVTGLTAYHLMSSGSDEGSDRPDVSEESADEETTARG